MNYSFQDGNFELRPPSIWPIFSPSYEYDQQSWGFKDVILLQVLIIGSRLKRIKNCTATKQG